MGARMSLLTLFSLILGLLCGLFFPEFSLKITLPGTLYLNVLKALILPVILCSIIPSVSRSYERREGLILKALLVFAGMFVMTYLLSSLIVILIDPAGHFLYEETVWEGNVQSYSFGTFLLNLLPKDLKGFLTGKYLFFTILLSFLAGLIAGKRKAQSFIGIVEKGREFLYRVLRCLMYLTPLAVFTLSAESAARYGTQIFLLGGSYILTAYVAGIIVLFLVMVLPVSLAGKRPFRECLVRIAKLWPVTLSTCSSAAALPYTLRICKEELRFDADTTDLCVPLGCTVNMCGGAVSFALLSLFTSRLYGISIDPGMYLTMLFAALLLNMAAPGIPGGGIAVGAAYLGILGIPLGFMGLYSGIYKVLDMLYTTLNVTGDITADALLQGGKRGETE